MQKSEPRSHDCAARTSVGVITTSVSRQGGGLFEAIRGFCEAARDEQVEVSVYGIQDADTEADIGAWGAINTIAFPGRGPRVFRYAAGMHRKILAAKHDVLHLHGLWQYSSIVAKRWRRQTGGRVLISPHGMLDSWAVNHSRWKKQIAATLFEGGNLRDASCLHALNEQEATAIRSFGLDAPIAVIPNGVDVPDTGEPSERPRWLGEDTRSVLLFLGRIHPKKGLSESLRAWAIVKQHWPAVVKQWRLVIAGWDDGGYRQTLEAMVRSLRIAEDVSFVGPLFGREKEQAYRHAKAFLLASHSEGLPMAILEAWSYGVPVFMTSACNLSIGFQAGGGVEVDSNPLAMAEALATHLIRPDLVRRGLIGKSLVVDYFQWPRVGRQMRSVYEWLAGRCEPPSFIRWH